MCLNIAKEVRVVFVWRSQHSFDWVWSNIPPVSFLQSRSPIYSIERSWLNYFYFYSDYYWVLHCRVTNSQHTTTRILGLINVPNLQILNMEWQNIDLRITQFSSYLNSVTCSKPKYQRPMTVFNVDDDGSESLCCSLVKSGVNCTCICIIVYLLCHL